jgi:hypothetical protein
MIQECFVPVSQRHWLLSCIIIFIVYWSYTTPACFLPDELPPKEGTTTSEPTTPDGSTRPDTPVISYQPACKQNDCAHDIECSQCQGGGTWRCHGRKCIQYTNPTCIQCSSDGDCNDCKNASGMSASKCYNGTCVNPSDYACTEQNKDACQAVSTNLVCLLPPPNSPAKLGACICPKSASTTARKRCDDSGLPSRGHTNGDAYCQAECGSPYRCVKTPQGFKQCRIPVESSQP